MRRLLLLALLAAPAGVPLAAQGTPERAAEAYGQAVRAGDWAAAARLMHPTALRQLHDLFDPLLKAPGAEQFGQQLFGVGSAAELATTPDTVLFARFLKNIFGQMAGLGDALSTLTFAPMGHVPGGGDTVLVVSRLTLTVSEVTISQFDVMPFILERGQWWGLLKADFTNMAAMLQRQVGGRRS